MEVIAGSSLDLDSLSAKELRARITGNENFVNSGFPTIFGNIDIDREDALFNAVEAVVSMVPCSPETWSALGGDNLVETVTSNFSQHPDLIYPLALMTLRCGMAEIGTAFALSNSETIIRMLIQQHHDTWQTSLDEGWNDQNPVRHISILGVIAADIVRDPRIAPILWKNNLRPYFRTIHSFYRIEPRTLLVTLEPASWHPVLMELVQPNFVEWFVWKDIHYQFAGGIIAGVDAKKAFLRAAMDHVFDGPHNLFSIHPWESSSWNSKPTARILLNAAEEIGAQAKYWAVGSLLALAFLYDVSIPVRLPYEYLASFLHVDITVEQLAHVEPRTHELLTLVQSMTSDDDLVRHSITIYGQTHTFRLDNREQLIDRYLRSFEPPALIKEMINLLFGGLQIPYRLRDPLLISNILFSGESAPTPEFGA